LEVGNWPPQPIVFLTEAVEVKALVQPASLRVTIDRFAKQPFRSKGLTYVVTFQLTSRKCISELSGKAIIDYFSAGFLHQWATEEFLRGQGLVLLKLNTFGKTKLKSKTSLPLS